MARRREDRDDTDVIVGSTHSYIANIVSIKLNIAVEYTTSRISMVSPLDRVSLYCAFKRVTLRTEENCKIAMIAEQRDYLANVIYALVAEKLV
ncbi:alcohol-forming fatty acyl-CoA reductase-like [Gossypium australe]|uniref:Alcohol-forming fatty acyl-CoA reductase-like n=1 Tax=Gossypium australe TaxID=47621 RepID=A0A5B6VV45_9ROSI|nr:alcohol-forming fatty acyl-CoA reductase-like [Gossypium australe]